jgi:molybdopterin-guanine dinucleotide biosynthesis protein A
MRIELDEQRLPRRARRGLVPGAGPQRDDQLEPLAAIYPKRCHRFAFERLFHGSRAVHDLAGDCLREQAVKVRKVPATEAPCFANWNRPDDVDATNQEG